MADITAFISLFIAGDTRVDVNLNNILDLSDVNLFVSSFLCGCR